MYFSTFTLFVLSHLATVHAQGPTSGFDTLTSPPQDSSFAVGSVLPIVWEAGSSTGTVSILLNGGPTPSTLQHLFVIGTSINSQAGGYNWTITPAVGSYATYGLNLTLDGNPITEYQESFPFHLTGGSASSSSSSSSVVSSSASSISSSSSASGSTSTVTASTTSAASTTAADLTPSATGSTASMTSPTTLTSTSSTPLSNGTASKTSSSKSSSTSSAATSSSSISSSAANVRPVQVLSASVALLSACLFVFAL